MQRLVVSLLTLTPILIFQSALAAPNSLTPSPVSSPAPIRIAFRDARDIPPALSSLDRQRLAEALRTPTLTEIQQGAILRLGQQGTAVVEIKALLSRLGYRVLPGALYDRETLAQVGAFQTQHRLLSPESAYWGLVGPETLEKLTQEARKLRYSPRLGKALVQYSRARVIGTERFCYRFVAEAIHAVMEPFLEGYHAYMAADQLAKSPYFHEVFPPLNELEQLPAGAIVVWGKGNSRSGHISIADGQGYEISDHIRPQMRSHYGGAGYRVFMPVEPQLSKL